MEKLHDIKAAYDDFYRELMERGELPMRDTDAGFWFSSLSDDVVDIFRKIGLNKADYFLDIGSADGKVTLLASQFCKNCFGVEYDELLVDKSREMQRKLGIRNARFFHKDYNDMDFRGFEFLFVYPDQPMERGLEKKLLRELTGKLVVYGPHFHPRRLKKIGSFFAGTTFVAVYTR